MGEADVTLSICVRCRDGRETDAADLADRGGRRLAEAVASGFAESRAAVLGVHLRGIRCMSQCKRACAIALSGPDRFTYLFGDLDPQRHAEDILSLAAAYSEAETGFLPREARPEGMRSGILGRIPPLDHDGEIVEPLFPTPPSQTQETKTK